MFITAYSQIKHITKERKSWLGVSLASSKDVSEIKEHHYVEIRGPVTICKKCGQASGLVLMTPEQLHLLIDKYPVLEPIRERIPQIR